MMTGSSRLSIVRPLAGQAWRFGLHSVGLSRPQWTFVGDGADWSIDQDGQRTLEVMKRRGIHVDRVQYPYFINSEILHFGSLHAYRPRREQRWVRAKHTVVTCFHGDFGIASSMDQQLSKLLEHSGEIDRLIISNATMQARFLRWGFPVDRLRQISVGVDIKRFTPVTAESREAARMRLGIPAQAVVIGSFQKDGNGWGEGLEPKRIKAPDVLCDVLTAVARDFPLHVLLTGPARGYVKRRLEASGIPFTHHLLDSPDALPAYYHACDCYLMCSREEGGPKSVPESMACGIPLVATLTGLARDVAAKFDDGWFAEVDNVNALIELTSQALSDSTRREVFRCKAPMLAATYSWEHVGEAHLEICRELTA